MWLSILLGLFLGAFIYLSVMFIITLIKRKKAKKKEQKENSIEE